MSSYPLAGWPQPPAPTDPAYAAYAAQYPYAAYGAYGAYPGYEGYYQQGYAAPGYPPQPNPPLPDAEPNGQDKAPSPPGEEPPGVASSSEHSTQTGAPPPPPPGSPSKPPAAPAAEPSAAAAAAQPTAQGAAYDAAAAAAYQQYYNSYYAPGYGSAAPGYPPTTSAAAPPPVQHISAYQAAPVVQHVSALAYQTPSYAGYNQNYSHYGSTHASAGSHLAPTTSKPAAQKATASGKSGSYNAVPPPTSLVSTGSNRTPISISIKAQQQGNAAGHRPQSYAAAAAAASTPAAHPAAISSPAYVKVATTTPTAAPSPTPARPSSQGSKFPPAFESWVTRCFECCRTDSERQAMTGRLKVRIAEVESAGRMWLVDWDREPVPTGGSGGAADRELGSSGGLRKRSRWEEAAQGGPPGADAYHSYASQHKKGKGNGAEGGGKSKGKYEWSVGETRKLAQRAGRFGDGSAGQRGGGRGRQYDADWDPEDGEGFDPGSVVIQGTSQVLEKSYFRLTCAPSPSEVRPPAVLRKALDRLVQLLYRDAINYFYACDQLKGMRQDCTVQHLRNELAVAVYEAHARAALEYGDLAEFNQCQTQLAAMYAEGIPSACQAEFMAYKLLYNTAHSQSGANKALMYTMRQALQMLQQHTSSAAASGRDPQGAIANAMRARTAACTANYTEFFTAYAAAPGLGRAILDVLVPRMRWAALNVLVKTYKTSLPVQFVSKALGFLVTPPAVQAAGGGGGGGTSADGLPLPGCRRVVYEGKVFAGGSETECVAACVRWLQAHGAVLEAPGTDSPLLDVKASLGKLFIPEEPKVAHGDDKLSVDDFLSRAAATRRAL